MNAPRRRRCLSDGAMRVAEHRAHGAVARSALSCESGPTNCSFPNEEQPVWTRHRCPVSCLPRCPARILGGGASSLTDHSYSCSSWGRLSGARDAASGGDFERDVTAREDCPVKYAVRMRRLRSTDIIWCHRVHELRAREKFLSEPRMELDAQTALTATQAGKASPALRGPPPRAPGRVIRVFPRRLHENMSAEARCPRQELWCCGTTSLHIRVSRYLFCW